MRKLVLTILMLALAGCVAPPPPKPQVPPPPAPAPVPPAAAFIPLKPNVYMVFKGAGAGIALADGVAATSLANADAVDPKHVVGKSEAYGLLFFPAEPDIANLPTVELRVGDKVTAYGQGAGSSLRMAEGTAMAPQCRPVPTVDLGILGCSDRTTFMFEGEGGPGFLGGPVLDAKSGRLAGMVVAFARIGDRHLVFAYRMSLIRSEWNRIVSTLPADGD
jgi:hypothetical protein